MALRHLSVEADAGKVNRLLDNMTDGSYVVVAVEVFDAPTSRYSNQLGATIGPWVLGPHEEVYAWLEENGYEEYDQQYSAGSEPDDN